MYVAVRHWACALEIIIAKEIILNSEKTTTKQNKHYTKKIEKLIVIYASIYYELHKNNGHQMEYSIDPRGEAAYNKIIHN